MPFKYNPITKKLDLVDVSAGTVSSFAFTDANGFDGTVTNPTITPTLSLTTTAPDTRVMFSASGAISSDAEFTYNATTNALSVGSVIQNVTNVTTSPYVVTATDYYLSVNSSVIPITIQMPNSPTQGRVIVIKDSKGNSAVNNITVTTVGGIVDIDGATTKVLNTNFSSDSFLFNTPAYEVF